MIKNSKAKKNRRTIESPSLLYKEYDWYEKLFPLALQKSCDGFFLPGLNCHLMGVSKNINLLQRKEAHFVTKVRIDKFYDMYIRISEGTMELMLDKGLGRAGRPFNIENISELEKAMLTGFSEHVSKILIPFLEPPPVVNFKRTNFDMTHLTFLIEDEENEKIFGRFIISVPDGRLSPSKIESQGDKFSYEEFYECNTDVRLVLGRTRFSVDELKNLEEGDLIILEDSDLSNLKMYVLDEEKIVHIEPNFNIEIPFNENNGGDEMADKAVPKNLWDTIEVDMYAELNPVKISLGNLKKIELGQIVDVAALYDNHITLRVENKIIGRGELVIVNDRYGVKIAEILQKDKPVSEAPVIPDDDSEEDNEENSHIITDNQEKAKAEAEASKEESAANEEDEFDYSDFELEDEDI
ncbi:FliM/FliN family flagellar motor switch protein [bacterium]|nr:FliM/FliN family flagellar motor switch protein [bacterium]